MNPTPPILPHFRLLRASLAALLLLPTAGFADYGIQVGAFRDPANAEGLIARLRQEGYPALAGARTPGGLHGVMVGPFPSAADARTEADRLAREGHGGFLKRLPGVLVAAGGDEPLGLEDLFMEAPAENGETAETAPDEAPANEMPALDPELEQLFATDTPDLPDQSGQAARPLTGFFQSELAYTTADPEHWSKFRNLLEVGGSGAFDNGVRWKLSGRLVYDAAFDLEDDFYPADVENDRRSEAMLRETYLDIPAGQWDFRVGRQHIIWGEMVGLFFADVVSAKDLRQSVAQEFDLLRIPQWAVRAERFSGDLHLEGIWIPYMTYNDIGEPGDDFYRLPIPVPAGMGAVVFNEEIPAHNLSNSAYGFKVSYLKEGWDLAGFYYRSPDASASFTRTVTGSNLVFQPEHHKIHQFGATLAKDLGTHLILKAEAVYTLDKRFSVEDLADSDGLVKQDVLDYVVGLEYTFDSGASVNVQGFQRWHPDHVDSMVPDEVESGYSLYATTSWMNGKLEPELLWVQGLNQGDWMARPRLTWHMAPDWRAAVGADYFGGRTTTLLGQFDQSDRVYAEVRYSY